MIGLFLPEGALPVIEFSGVDRGRPMIGSSGDSDTRRQAAEWASGLAVAI